MPGLLTYGNYEKINVCYFKHRVCGNLLHGNRKLIQSWRLGIDRNFPLLSLLSCSVFPFSLADSLPHFISISLFQNVNVVLGSSHSSVTYQLHGLGQITLPFWPSLSRSVNRNAKKVVMKIKRDNAHKCLNTVCGYCEWGRCTEAGESLRPHMSWEI